MAKNKKVAEKPVEQPIIEKVEVKEEKVEVPVSEYDADLPDNKQRHLR